MCSTFGIRDFPIVNSVPVTPSLNALIYEEIPLDIQWGPKATEPTFIRDGPYANLGYLEYMNASNSTTTLRLNGNSFSLISVQLCTSQHKTLLPEAKQKDCSGELVIGFKASNKISEDYLFLCVPILTRPTTTLSVYLEALRAGRLDGKPTSLLSVLPSSDMHYISYSTCLQRIETNKTSTTQVRIFVFTEGLSYPAASFLEIARKITASAVSGPVYLPTIQLPDGLVDKSQALPFSITTETDYKSLLRYSQYYPKGSPDSRTREDNLNSYKCVPLEPSQNVKDGKIIVDTETGELLSQVLKDNTDAGTGGRTKITPAIVEQILAVCIAVILVAFIFLIVAYIITNMTTGNADTFFGIIKQNAGVVPPIVFFSALVGVVCFMLGIFLRNLV